jgi:hydroxylamine reductase
MVVQGQKVGIMSDPDMDEDIRSLRELFTYGLKEMAAYADHALILGKKNEEVTAFFYKGLNALTDDSLTVEDWLGLNMELGKVNLDCMGLLDNAHTSHFGNPVPNQVFLGAKKGPAILVSGHDLRDLEELLK